MDGSWNGRYDLVPKNEREEELFECISYLALPYMDIYDSCRGNFNLFIQRLKEFGIFSDQEALRVSIIISSLVISMHEMENKKNDS